MNEMVNFAKKLHMWQLSVLIAMFLLVLGFTGGIPYLDIELRPGRSQQAITGGMLFFFLGVNLKLMEMLIDLKKGDDDESK